MIHKSIKLHPEPKPVGSEYSYSQKTWEELQEEIEAVKKLGFVVGARVKFKFGQPGTIMAYKDWEKGKEMFLRNSHPDIIRVLRDNEVNLSNTMYNVTELELIPAEEVKEEVPNNQQ